MSRYENPESPLSRMAFRSSASMIGDEGTKVLVLILDFDHAWPMRWAKFNVLGENVYIPK